MKNQAAIKIAKYIRNGWKLTSYHCPICNTPLVSKENRYYCAICEKDVKIVKSDEEYREIIARNTLEELRTQILNAIQKIFITENWHYDDNKLKYIQIYLEILKTIKEILL